MESTDKKLKFIELRANNNSFAKISENLGVSKQTLIRWSKDLNDEIVNLKNLNKDELIETLNVSKSYRLKRLKSILDKVQNEIDKRDFSDISTEKLFKIESDLSREIARGLDIKFNLPEDDFLIASTRKIEWQAE